MKDNLPKIIEYAPKDGSSWSEWLQGKSTLINERLEVFNAVLSHFFNKESDFKLEYEVYCIIDPETHRVKFSKFTYDFWFSEEVCKVILSQQLPILNLIYINFLEAIGFIYAINQCPLVDTPCPLSSVLIGAYNQNVREIKKRIK